MEGRTTVIRDDVKPITSSTTIKQFREYIKAKTGIPLDEQVLIYAGKPLTDLDYATGKDLTVGDFGIQENSTVNLGLRVRGGAQLELKVKFDAVDF